MNKEAEKKRLAKIVFEGEDDKYTHAFKHSDSIWFCVCFQEPFACEINNKWVFPSCSLPKKCKNQPETDLHWTETLLKRREVIMNNRFKFRAYLPDAKIKYGGYEGDMYYQENQYLMSFLRRICNHYYVDHPAKLPFEIEERLTQSTGIKDKNGVLIFENDILKVWFYDADDDEFVVAPVKWSNNFAGFDCVNALLREMDMDTIFLGNSDYIVEVIGNIYENPELVDE